MELSDLIYLFEIPFREHGRDYNGIDCWGLVYLFYKDFFGIELNSHESHYEFINKRVSKENVGNLISNELSTGYWKEKTSPDFGDVAVLNLAGRPFHVGTVIDPNKKVMIHCLENIGVCQEEYNSLKYINRIEGFYEYVR